MQKYIPLYVCLLVFFERKIFGQLFVKFCRQVVIFGAVIDKSLDLEKISRRNDSYFSLSSWRIVFSFLFLFSIFKIFRQQISFFSRFARFLKSILFLFSIFKIVKTKVSFYSRFMRLCSLFLFLFL